MCARETDELRGLQDPPQATATGPAGGVYQWRRQTIAETFQRIRTDIAHPWLALGDFLDDYRFTAVGDRVALIGEGPVLDDEDGRELRRWASFCAATVEWLCWQDGLPFPAWTASCAFRLPEPWFLYPGDLLRAWQLATTPAPFKLRNIFGGDEMLTRV